jgi:transketolase
MQTKTYVPRRHFADLLHARMAADDRIWMIAGDLGYGLLKEIERDFPDRFVNVGAAEQLLVGAGVGLALSGKIPVCYTITPFYLRASEWLKNYLDHEKINVKLVGAGLDDDYSHDGYSHHLFNIDKHMACYPNVELYQPGREPEALEYQFKTFMDAQYPGLMILRK